MTCPPELRDRPEEELMNQYEHLTPKQERILAKAICSLILSRSGKKKAENQQHTRIIEHVRRRLPKVFFQSVKRSIKTIKPSIIAKAFHHTLDDQGRYSPGPTFAEYL